MLSKEVTPQVTASPTTWNQALLALMPTATAPYRIPLLLSNGHVETIYAAKFRKKPHLMYNREILHMPDGGCVCLDTEELPAVKQLPPDAPVVILLPGLTGGSEDSYVQHAVRHARDAGIRAVVFNSRGTSDSPVTTAQFYSASFTEDMRNVVAHVRSKYPSSLLFAAGWSLGANVLTRYLGEEGDRTPISAAAALCNPFNLPMADRNFQSGFNNIYNWNLGFSLRRIYRKHHHLFVEAAQRGEKPFKPDVAYNVSTIRDFDDAITRVAFDWPSVDAYYAGSSSADVVDRIAIPFLAVQAADDPIAPKEAIPFKALEENPNCLLVLTPTGGHLGWCSGKDGTTGAPWTDWLLVEYFTGVRQLLGQPETRGKRLPQGAVRPPTPEPAGLYSEGSTSHQAP